MAMVVDSGLIRAVALKIILIKLMVVGIEASTTKQEITVIEVMKIVTGLLGASCTTSGRGV